MSDTHTNGSQFITETGASSTGNGDGEWQEIRSQRKGGTPPSPAIVGQANPRFLLE